MIIYVRFSSTASLDPAEVEEAALGALGRAGTVLGASKTSVDLEIGDDVEARTLLQALAAALRRVGLPPSTVIDLPESGQRFGIFDF